MLKIKELEILQLKMEIKGYEKIVYKSINEMNQKVDQGVNK